MAKRTVYFYDIILRAKGKSRADGNVAEFDTQPKSMKEIIGYVQELFSSGDNFLQKGYIENAASIYIEDFSIEEGKAIFLINRCDPSAPDAVSANPVVKSRVVHKKPENHGGEYSAHVIIYLDPARGEDHYLCIFESAHGSGLSSTSIRSYLGHVIRHCKKQKPKSFQIPNINGATTKRGERLLVHHIHDVSFRGHPSDQFLSDLQTGTLSTIELVSYSQVGATWDDKGFVKEKKRTVELEPNQDLIGDSLQAVRNVRDFVLGREKQYGTIRLKFKTESGDSKDVNMSTDSGELDTPEAYVKKHALGIDSIKSNSFEFIQRRIIQKMTSFI